MFEFSHYGAFVNPARAPLGTISLMNHEASISNEMAICLMSGVVTECLLFDSAVLGRYQGTLGVHGGKRLWDQTVWSITFDLPFGESTCVTGSEIVFPMQVEDPNGKTNKNSKFPSALSMALKAASSLPGADYASSMGYGDDILVLAIRLRQFEVVASLHPDRDLNAFTLITVGYSLSV
ncbi:hypothetical protein ARMSODRAFT_972878 [Armillaria solidipes]|uniref:Uncharacterized protein n=1 Tax=Armillaria solidipes TaxID=1076256 RepID=A0A2H3BMU6_9AGAR|nr:hypothetical protein ARMSODRAFT_972878 [Armillaria solidipes]